MDAPNPEGTAIDHQRGVATTTQDTTPSPARWAVVLVLSCILAIYIGNWVATLTMAGLMKQHPTWLILLNPHPRNLILVAPRVDPLVMFAIGLPRSLLLHVLWFQIGRWYGAKGIAWIRKRSPDIGMIIEWVEKHFPKFGWLFCLLYIHPVVWTMAGASRMRAWFFYLVSILGVVLYITLAVVGGVTLSDYIVPLTDFADKYKWQIMGITLVLMMITVALNRSLEKIESVDHMRAELEGETTSESDEHSTTSRLT